jgi:predicted enzyme related to lactoylglutathione lyase
MNDLELGTILVYVRDLARSTDFYRDRLGLAVRRVDVDHGYVSFDLGSVQLGLVEAGEDLVGRQTGIGFRVADIEATHRDLVGAGVRFLTPPEPQPWGASMAVLCDPDGNIFYLEQPAPGGALH